MRRIKHGAAGVRGVNAPLCYAASVCGNVNLTVFIFCKPSENIPKVARSWPSSSQTHFGRLTIIVTLGQFVP